MDIQEIIKKDKESRNFVTEFEGAFFKMRRPQQMEFYAYMARCGIKVKEVDGQSQVDSSADADFQFLKSVTEFVYGWDNVKVKDFADDGTDELVDFSQQALNLYLDRHPAAYGALSKAMQDNYNEHYIKEDVEKKVLPNTASKLANSTT